VQFQIITSAAANLGTARRCWRRRTRSAKTELWLGRRPIVLEVPRAMLPRSRSASATSA
jgi:hypothetical protein